MKRVAISFSLILFIFCHVAFAQWSSNPAVNNQVSSGYSGATDPYIVTHPCGVTYISWFTPTPPSGFYFPWIQKLDVLGYPQWSTPVQVSSNTSMTWITDYSLAVTCDTCALVAFQDMRTGNNDVFIYKMGQDGSFLWGDDGVQLSDTPDFEANPVMAVHTDGSVVVAWPRMVDNGDSKVVLQRLSSTGQKTWANDVVLGEIGFDYTWPRIIPVENGNSIVVFYKEWGPYWAPNRIIHAQKIDSAGNSLWSPKPILFNGATPLYVHPSIAPDGLGGVYVCWMYEQTASHLSSFVQHVSEAGLVTMAGNGVEVTSNINTLALEPAIGCDETTHSAYIFWRETDLNQNVYGLFGQRMDMTGNRKWGNNGLQIEAVGTQNAILLNVTPLQGGAIVGYEYDFFGSGADQMIRTCRLDSAGTKVWSGGTRTVSSFQSGKGKLAAGPRQNSQVIYAWTDDRLSGEQIFAQNLCENGTYGPIDDSFIVIPDTLFFLTSQEIVDGKMFHIVNPHDYSIDIQYIQNSGIIEPLGAFWYTYPYYSNFPVNLSSGDSLGILVKWPIIDQTGMLTLLYDTLHINTINYSGQTIIAVDSLLILTGLQNHEKPGITAFPNPFKESIVLGLTMDEETEAEIIIFNTMMQPVRTLFDGRLMKGKNNLAWDGTDIDQVRVVPGVYLVSIRTRNGQETLRVVVL